MATNRGSLFDPELVSDLITKVRGKSSIAELCAQTPIPFNGLKEFTFTMDKEIDIVAEEGKKSEGGISMAPIKIVPIKFEYGARVSDEFLYANEEEQIDILTTFNEGFAKKVAKGRGHRHRAAIPRGGSKPFARTSLHTEAGRANADVNPKEEPAAPLSHRLRKATRRRSFERTSPMRAGSRPCRAMLRKKAPRKEETKLPHPPRPGIGASRARVDPASARRGHG